MKKLVNSAASQEFEDKIRDFLNKGQGLQENQVLRAKQELGLLLVCAWDKLFVSVSDSNDTVSGSQDVDSQMVKMAEIFDAIGLYIAEERDEKASETLVRSVSKVTVYV